MNELEKFTLICCLMLAAIMAGLFGKSLSKEALGWVRFSTVLVSLIVIMLLSMWIGMVGTFLGWFDFLLEIR